MTAHLKNNLYTVKQAASFLKVSGMTLRRWDEKGILNPKRTKGGQRRYRDKDLQAFLLQRSIKNRITQTEIAPQIFQNGIAKGTEKLQKAEKKIEITEGKEITTGTKITRVIHDNNGENNTDNIYSDVLIEHRKFLSHPVLAFFSVLILTCFSVIAIKTWGNVLGVLIGSAVDKKFYTSLYSKKPFPDGDKTVYVYQDNNKDKPDVLGVENVYASTAWQPSESFSAFDSNAFNLLRNSSFEAGDDATHNSKNEFGQPIFWGYSGLAHKDNIFVSQGGVYDETLGLKLEDKGLTNRANLGFNQASVTTKLGRDYNLSIYLKTVNIRGSPSLRIGFIGGEGEDVWNEFVLSNNQDWFRAEFVYYTASKGKYPFFEIIDYQGGAIYFDSAQLTTGTTPIVYNRQNTTIGDGSIIASTFSNIYPYFDNKGSLGTPDRYFNSLYVTNANFKKLNVEGLLTIGELKVNGPATVSGDFKVEGKTIFGGVIYTWPGSDGTSGQALTTNASGTLSWTTIAGGVTSLTGTANQITVSAATGAITLSLPAALIAPGSLTTTTTLSVQGTTIGLNNDADDDNVLSYGSGSAAAAQGNLYWGSSLLCTASDANCGWGTGSGTSFWQLNSHVLSPTISSYDFMVGGQIATPSSQTANYFQVFGGGTTAGDATSSGIITMGTNRTSGIIETERMLPLVLGSSTTGSIQLSPKGTTGLFVNGAGNVGIGTTSPTASLEVGDGTDSIQFSSVGDITFVDANSTASITGPAGGALQILAGSAQTLTFADATTGLSMTADGVINDIDDASVSVNDDLTVQGGDITGANGAALDIGEATSGDITVTGDLLVAEDSFIGLSSSTERLAFDGSADVLSIMDSGLRIYDSTDTDYIQISHDGTDVNITTATTTALNITSTQVEIGNGTDYLQIATTGDLTFVDDNSSASITGPANGALEVLAGTSQALTLTGNAASTWGAAGGLTIQNLTSGNLNLTSAGEINFDDVTTGSIPFALDDTVLNTPTSAIIDAINEAYAAGTGGAGALWQRNSGILSPRNITDGLLIGQTATSSSQTADYFQIFGTGITAGDATSSGIITMGTNRTSGIIETERMLPLILGSATTGSVQLAPNGTTGLFVNGLGNVGIGNTSPTAALSVTGDMTLSGGDITGANGAALDIGEATSGDITVTGDLLVAEDSFIGLSSSTERLAFDGSADVLSIMDSGLRIYDSTDTDYIQISHDGTDATVSFANTTALNLNIANVDVSAQATDIEIADNTASALTISQGSNNYLLMTTTNDNEVVTLDLPAGGATTLTGNLFISNIAKTINLGTGTAADTINIGTGATNADVLTFGNTGVATTFDFNSGAATVDAFDLALNSISTANGMDIGLNAISTGNGIYLNSTSTALTTGNLLELYWAPDTFATASGDLFRINIGANADTTGNLLAIYDNLSDVFKISTTQITSALPHQFTAAGDVAIAYDLALTNQTASYIKSNAPLYIEAGESFESNDLTLRTYNYGSIILDGSAGVEITKSATISGSLALGTSTAAAGPGNLDIGGNMIVRGYATGSASLGLGTSSAPAGPGNFDMSGNMRVRGYATMSASLTVGTFNASAGPGNALFSGQVAIQTTDHSTHAINVVGTAGLSTGTAWTNTSDLRFKDVQADLSANSLDKIMALRPISYTWNDLHDQKFGKDPGLNFGFIAQEVNEIIPEFISQDKEGYYYYNPSGIESLLTSAIQEQQGQIENISLSLGLGSQSNSISGIEKEINLLDKRIQKIEEQDNTYIYKDMVNNIGPMDIVSYSSQTSIEKASYTDRNYILGVAENINQAKAQVKTSGYGKIKATSENGDIKKGDLIAISSLKEGYGSKAIDQGMVLGVAISDLSNKIAIASQSSSFASPSSMLSNNDSASPSASKSEEEKTIAEEGDLEVLVNLLWYDGGSYNSSNILGATSEDEKGFSIDKNAYIAGDIDVSGTAYFGDIKSTGDIFAGIIKIDGVDGSINAVGSTLKLQDLYGSGNIEAFGGNIVMTTKGNIKTVGEITAKKYNIDNSDMSKASAGTATIEVGKTSITIKTTALTDKSLIFVTPERPVILGSNKTSEDTFEITVSSGQSSDLKVNWWIVN